MIQQTSLDVYVEILPKVNTKQQLVYGIIKMRGPLTNAEISRVLSWPINTVTPRVLELRQKGYVRQHCIRQCNVTHNNANCWGSV